MDRSRRQISAIERQRSYCAPSLRGLFPSLHPLRKLRSLTMEIFTAPKEAYSRLLGKPNLFIFMWLFTATVLIFLAVSHDSYNYI